MPANNQDGPMPVPVQSSRMFEDFDYERINLQSLAAGRRKAMRQSDSNQLDSIEKEEPLTVDRMPRVLLVEDHADLADVTAEFLRSAGLEVRLATTGAEALTSAAAFRPDIVLCDLSLLDMTGLEIARVLRESPVTRDTLFAVHTALSKVDICTLERNVPTGDVNLYLSKPMTVEKLDRLLAAFEFSRQSATGAALAAKRVATQGCGDT